MPKSEQVALVLEKASHANESGQMPSQKTLAYSAQIR
jgi:hypothetical protein